ncbi:MAG: DUF5719 family protein [Acidimicrobiia bacterium]
MSRVLSVLLLIALAAGAALASPPGDPVPGDAPGYNPPPVAVCAVEQGSGQDTTTAVLSTVNGEGTVTAFSGGVAAGSSIFQTGASGSATVPLVDVAAVGVAAGLLEFPNAEASAASLITGPTSVALEGCQSKPAEQTLLAGGSTVSGQTFEIQLMNPYAGEAVVDLAAVSESGLETAPQLEDITVPSRSSALIDMSQILPGRESMSVTVTVSQGSILAVGRLSDGTDLALWNAVTPATDWFVPVPGDASGEIVISTGVGSDVAYQVDVYGPEGLVEAADEGVVPARGQVTVDLGELGGSTGAMRVIAAQPVGVFLRTVADDGLAITSGASTPAARWLLPGAGSIAQGQGSLVILNTGLDDATVVVTDHRPDSVAEQFVVPAGQVVEFEAIVGTGDGYSVTGDGDLVVLWSAAMDTARVYAMGTPILDE